MCEGTDCVTHRLLRRPVALRAAAPAADALVLTLEGRRRLLVNIPVSPTSLTSVSCSHFPVQPPPTQPALVCLPLRLSHLRLASTRQCYPPSISPAFPPNPAGPDHRSSTPLGRVPLAPAPDAPDWWTPSGFPGEPPSIITATSPAQPRNAAATELTGSLWPPKRAPRL